MSKSGLELQIKEKEAELKVVKAQLGALNNIYDEVTERLKKEHPGIDNAGLSIARIEDIEYTAAYKEWGKLTERKIDLEEDLILAKDKLKKLNKDVPFGDER